MRIRREQHTRLSRINRCWRAAIIAASAAIVIAVSSSALLAHESRRIGPNGEYTFVIGFRSEPAFEDDVNAAEIIIVRTGDQRPINAAAGDVVDLTVEVQLRESEDFNAAAVQAANLANPAQGFGTTNRYYSLFRPTVNGTYAFRIRGTVSDASAPSAGPVTVDETFVCGLGSLGTGAFNCVRDPQTFPTGAQDKHGRDRHGYIDDDSLQPFIQH